MATVPRRSRCTSPHAEIAQRMKRYQKLLGPIALGLCAWGVVLGYCAKSGECREPVRDVVEAVSAAGFLARCCEM